MTEWTPIVHGRTAFVDFRAGLLAGPRDFGPEDVSWAKDYILATTRSGNLSEGPIWSVFQNERYFVAGVTCMARDVSDEKTRELVIADGHEIERRPLYVFLGYTARKPVTEIPRRELAIFRPLYHFVVDRWREKWHDAAAFNPSDETFAIECVPLRPSFLNADPLAVEVWPEQYLDELWCGAGASGVSLCIGASSPGSLHTGLFGNIVIRGTATRTLLPRRAPEPPRDPSRVEKPRNAAPRPKTTRPQIKSDHNVTLFGIFTTIVHCILRLFGTSTDRPLRYGSSKRQSSPYATGSPRPVRERATSERWEGWDDDVKREER